MNTNREITNHFEKANTGAAGFVAAGQRPHRRLIPFLLLLLVLASLFCRADDPPPQIRFRDRLALPGLRISREEVRTLLDPEPEPPSAKPVRKVPPPVPPAPRFLPHPHPGLSSTGSQPLNRLDPAWAIALAREWNPSPVPASVLSGKYHPVDENGQPLVSSFTSWQDRDRFRLESGTGANSQIIEGFHEQVTVRQGGTLKALSPRLQPGFCPWLPASSLGALLPEWQARGELILLAGDTWINETGEERLELLVVHRPPSRSPYPWQFETGEDRERVYRFELGPELLPRRLSFRGAEYIYEDWRWQDGLAYPARVKCQAGAAPVYEMMIEAAAVAPAFPASAPAAGRRMEDGGGQVNFDAAKVWNPAIPDNMGGDAPFGVFTNGSVAQINIQNLNLLVNLPLASYPQRGGLAFSTGLVYNSKVWEVGQPEPFWPLAKTLSPPKDDIFVRQLTYSAGAVNGWRNMAGFYSVQTGRELYDSLGLGRADSPLATEPEKYIRKVMKKLYLHLPDGATHELMEVDEPGLDRLYDKYENRLPVQVRTRHWESTDGSNIRVELGNRGYSTAVAAAGSRIFSTAGPGGLKVLESQGDAPPVLVAEAEVPELATSLCLAGDFLFVGTEGAGLLNYLIDAAGVPRLLPGGGSDTVLEMRIDPAARRLWLLSVSSGYESLSAPCISVHDLSRLPEYKIVATEPARSGIFHSLELFAGGAVAAGSYSLQFLSFQPGRLAAGPSTPAPSGWIIHDIAVLGSQIIALLNQGSQTALGFYQLAGNQLQLQEIRPLPVVSYRMTVHEDRVYLLDTATPGGGSGLAVYQPSTGQLLERPVFAEAKVNRVKSLAFLPAAGGSRIVIAGGQPGELPFFQNTQQDFLTALDAAAVLDPGQTTVTPVWHYEQPWRDTAISLANGTRIEFHPDRQSITDVDGNQLQITLEGEPGQPRHPVYHDTVGRTVEMPLPQVWPGDAWANDAQLPDQAGWVPPGYSQAFQLDFANIFSSLSQASAVAECGILTYPPPACQAGVLFPCSRFHQLRPLGCHNPKVLKQLQLPNGQLYQFEYNAYGEMTKIVYPTGGYERFEYDEIPRLEFEYSESEAPPVASRGVVRRFVSPAGDGTDEVAWTYQSRLQSIPGGDVLLRSVRFYSSAAALAAGQPPDRLEEHYFVAKQPRKFGLTRYLHGLEFEVRTYAKNAAGALELQQQICREQQAGYYDPAHIISSGDLLLGQRNPLPSREVAVLCQNGQPGLATVTEYSYYRKDEANPASYYQDCLLKEKRSYDFAPCTALVNYNPFQGLQAADALRGTLLRTERYEYLSEANAAEYAPGHSYADYPAAGLRGQPVRKLLLDGAGQTVRETRTVYDQDGPVRGKPTAIRHRVADGIPFLEERRGYDGYGNLIWYETPEGRRAEWEYGATFQHALVTRQTVGPAGGTRLSSTYTYEPVTGLLTGSTGPNGEVSQFQYDDPLHRLTWLSQPGGRTASLVYDDAGRRITVSGDWSVTGDQAQQAVRCFDQLGRRIAEGSLTGSGTWRWTRTRYDAFGRTAKVSNPLAGGAAPPPVEDFPYWTENVYDGQDRVISVIRPGGATARTEYTLNVKKVITETGHWKRYTHDAAGRVTEVAEPSAGSLVPPAPAGKTADGDLLTGYTWNAAGQLLTVDQGSQHRQFGYDGLGRLITASYPEIEFEKRWEYTPDGLLWKEHTGPLTLISPETGDPENPVDPPFFPDTWIEYEYDPLARVTAKSHRRQPAAGPAETVRGWWYQYDGGGPLQPFRGKVAPAAPFALGRLTAKGESGGPLGSWEQQFTYDAEGRVTAQRWLFSPEPPGLPPQGYLQAVYTWNVSGGLVSLAYPSGFTAVWRLDRENRPLDLGEPGEPGEPGTLASAITWQDGASGGGAAGGPAHGALASLTFGVMLPPPIVEPVPDPDPEPVPSVITLSRQYDPARLWLTDFAVSANPEAGEDLLPRQRAATQFGYQYFPDGNIAAISHPEFDDSTVTIQRESFTYDALDRITEANLTLWQDWWVDPDTNPEGTQEMPLSFAYDRFGNMLARNGGISHLIPYPAFDYTADAAEVALHNRLPVDTVRYDTDGRGILRGPVDAQDHATEWRIYDLENRLEEYWVKNAGSWTRRARYGYDDGIGRTVTATSGDGSVWRWHLNDPSGQELTEIHQDPQLAELSCGVPGGELAVRYQVLDHLGTPRLTLGASLTPDSRYCFDPSIPALLDKLVYCRMEGLLERYHFDPFGTPLFQSHQKTGPSGGLPESIAGWTGNSGGMNAVANRSGDAGGGWDGPPLAAGGTGAGDWSGAPLAGENQTRFYSCQNGSENWCFTGKPREDAGDLFGARFYQYQHARWLSPDGPLEDSWIQEPQSWNLYQYVRNNPVNHADPDGRQLPYSVKGTGRQPFIGPFIDESWWLGFTGSAVNTFMTLLGCPDNLTKLRDPAYQSSPSGFRAGQWAGVAGVAMLAVADGPAAAESGGGQATKQALRQVKTVVNEVDDALRSAQSAMKRIFTVTPKGVAISSETLSLQGTSALAGNFRGLKGASVEEIISRIPATWKMLPQDRGLGIKFVDEAGLERIRIHGPSANAPSGSNSASGWILRIMDRAGNYLDDCGNIVNYKANEGHIPIKGNPNS